MISWSKPGLLVLSQVLGRLNNLFGLSTSRHGSILVHACGVQTVDASTSQNVQRTVPLL